jgi:alkanesulfonate monooxygenase SsuD/methylene tetrahydromethanopterin reductase-like flavin-dependent oxidoreductase (luciferase family)
LRRSSDADATRRLKFGCAFNILPMWHPIRLAEDYAMADIVTDGRVIMGVGRGYHTREVETFGAPLSDEEANRALFEEQLQLLLRCFDAPAFHHKGKYYECPPPVDYRGYRLKDITVAPRPKHLPVDIWMPIASGKTIDLMAQYGLKAMATLNGEKILDDAARMKRSAVSSPAFRVAHADYPTRRSRPARADRRGRYRAGAAAGNAGCGTYPAPPPGRT